MFDSIKKWLLEKFFNTYLKQAVKWLLEFFDGKKTVLSIIAAIIIAVLKAYPQLDNGFIEAILAALTEMGASPDSLTFAAVIGFIIGLFDKIRKWVAEEKATEIK